MLSMVKLIMHRHVRIATSYSRLPAWLTYHRALSFSLLFDISRCRTLHHHLRNALALAPVSLCQLALIFLTLDHCPLSTDDRTKQIDEHVNHVHNASKSQRNSNPNPYQTHPHHCERCYDYDPIRCRSTVAIALSAFVIVSHNNSHSPQVEPFTRSSMAMK